MMKLIVDKMPVTANECLFSAMGTGKPRCRHDGKLCPLLRGEACPYLTENVSPEPIKLAQEEMPVESAPEPKKRATKRSTAKKAD